MNNGGVSTAVDCRKPTNTRAQLIVKPNWNFFRNIDILSVPTAFQEPKGLYALEAMAAGIPVVLPSHGAFPELLEASGGGLLFEPGNVAELAQSFAELLDDDERRLVLGGSGQQFVHRHRNATVMAKSTSKIIREFLM